MNLDLLWEVRFGSWSSALVMQLYILELVEGSFDRPAVLAGATAGTTAVAKQYRTQTQK